MTTGCGFKKIAHESKGSIEKNRMSAVVSIAKELSYDKLESRIRIAEAKLEMAKARGETAKAQIEIKVIAALLMKQLIIVKKLRELRFLERRSNNAESE
jgi:hypothetical protein